jgi:hypothetical protein
MAYYDGRMASLEPAIQSSISEINELKAEIESLHRALDEAGAVRWGPNGQMKLGERLVSIFEKGPDWEKVK